MLLTFLAVMTFKKAGQYTYCRKLSGADAWPSFLLYLDGNHLFINKTKETTEKEKLKQTTGKKHKIRKKSVMAKLSGRRCLQTNRMQIIFLKRRFL
jgi:methionyl-tRNA formyltransferase